MTLNKLEPEFNQKIALITLLKKKLQSDLHYCNKLEKEIIVCKKDFDEINESLLEKINDIFNNRENEIIRILSLEKPLIQVLGENNIEKRNRTEYVAQISHELRTPLNIIIGFAEVLKDQLMGSLNDEQNIIINDILNSSDHLLSLINEILDISKIESKKIILKKTNFSLAELINECSYFLNNNALKESIKIYSTIPPDLPCIFADKKRIKQILLNLLSNAIKFTPENGKIGIIAENIGESIKITVWDTGIGIKKDNIKDLFKPFCRIQTEENFQKPGTGLGLYLSKVLAELHNGTIYVESTVNKGSDFYLEIPISEIPDIKIEMNQDLKSNFGKTFN